MINDQMEVSFPSFIVDLLHSSRDVLFLCACKVKQEVM